MQRQSADRGLPTRRGDLGRCRRVAGGSIEHLSGEVSRAPAKSPQSHSLPPRPTTAASTPSNAASLTPACTNRSLAWAPRARRARESRRVGAALAPTLSPLFLPKYRRRTSRRRNRQHQRPTSAATEVARNVETSERLGYGRRAPRDRRDARRRISARFVSLRRDCTCMDVHAARLPRNNTPYTVESLGTQ